MAMRIVVVAGTAAATRLGAATVTSAESHFASTCGRPTEGIRAGDSGTVAVAVVAAGVVDTAAGAAV